MEAKEKLLQDYEKLRQERSFFRKLKIWLVLVSIAIFAGFYAGNLMFGPNGFEVLWDLNRRIEELSSDIERLKDENALLQKRYFEFKNIQGYD